MGHPRMYSDDDQYLRQLREVCLALPEATEVEAWGRPTFRAGKIFAVYGSGQDHPHAVIFKPDEEDRVALTQQGRFFSPPYFGPGGWLALDLEATETDWAEISELMESSYRQVALKRMLKALDSD